MEDLQQLLAKKEKLHPDLQQCVEDMEHFKALRHPILYSVPYFESMNAFHNKQYEARKEELIANKKNKHWESFVFLHERPHRLVAFMEIEKELSDNAYWHLLGHIWLDSENIWQLKGTWLKALKSKREHGELFMTGHERIQLRKMTNTMTVYRGCSNKNKHGYSYTLDLEKAKMFAQKWGVDAMIVEKTIKKKDVFAYISRRNESEIILL